MNSQSYKLQGYVNHFENKVEIESNNKIEFDKFQVFSLKDNKEITSKYNT